MNDAAHTSTAITPDRLGNFWRLRPSCVLLALAMISGSLAAQTLPDEPVQRPLRIDVTPLIGYRTSMSFPTDTAEGVESTTNVILDASPTYGVSVGMRVDEENLVEFRWARQDTYFHLDGAAPSAKERVILDQYLGDFTHEYFMEDWRSWARPFVMGSVGAAHVSAGAGNSFTRFTFGLGGGIKFYFNRHFGVRIQGEWLPVFINPSVGAVVCGGGCVAKLTATVVSQGEVLIGPVFRF